MKRPYPYFWREQTNQHGVVFSGNESIVDHDVTGRFPDHVDRNALRLHLMPRWIPPLRLRRIEPERAARAAQRRNDRLKAKVPLFAGDDSVTGATWTGDAFADEIESRMAAMYVSWERIYDRALAYRTAAIRLVGQDQVEAWDNRFRFATWPHSEEYLADYWWDRLRGLGLSRAEIAAVIGALPTPADLYFDDCDEKGNG